MNIGVVAQRVHVLVRNVDIKTNFCYKVTHRCDIIPILDSVCAPKGIQSSVK